MILHKLEQFRRRLLDLSRRNRLLNFRPTGRRSIHIIDEVAAEVFRILVGEMKAMQFLAAEESPFAKEAKTPLEDSEEDVGTLWFELPAVEPEGEPAERHIDRNLQTALTGKHLQARLLHLSREAKSAQDEQGANVLHLALGLLHWKENPDSNVISAAPLLLVPVELHRRSVNQRHTVRALDDDTVVNPALHELCRRNYDIGLPPFDPEGESPIESFFGAVKNLIQSIDGWSMQRNEIHLGLFSFAKLLMYLDLDPNRWPEEEPLHAHDLVRALCAAESEAGGVSMRDGLIDPATLDERLPPEETFHILDADSSQQAAIVAANEGQSFVIEGPPGTGKSQTIANIIAESLAAGKRILFVAEKAAALEVVKRRLEQVGLGHFVAELHSRKANKRLFAEELGRAMRAEHPRLSDDHVREAEQLAEARRAISAYTKRLHQRIEPLGISVYQAMGLCACLEDAPEAAVTIPEAPRWSHDKLREVQSDVAALARAAERTGEPIRHPWRGVGVEDLPLHERQRLPRLLLNIREAADSLLAALQDMAEPLSAPVPHNLAGCGDFSRLVKTILEAPPLSADALSNSAWNEIPSEAHLALDTGRQLEKFERDIAKRWQPEAHTLDWSPIASSFRRQAHSPLRWLNPGWWSNRSLIRKHLAEGAAFDRDDVLTDLASLETAARLREMLLQLRIQGAQHFGALWRDDRSNWDALAAYAESLVALRRIIVSRDLDPTAISAATQPENRERVETLHQRFLDQAGNFQAAWRTFQETLRIDGSAFFAAPLDDVEWDDWIARSSQCEAALESLDDWMALERSRRRLAGAKLDDFFQWAVDSFAIHSPSSWPDAFDRQFHRIWLDEVTRNWSEVREFSGQAHEQLIARFRELDLRWIELTRARVAALVAQRQPGARQAMSTNSGLGILQAEMRRKRGHRPIRKLLSSPAGDVIAALKPCFMMSPMSVAQFLEPGRFTFDVIIFDEASQVDPADSLGAVARGRQLLLVGDEKQLPPTDFFRSMSAADEEDDEDALPTGDLESVLALGQVTLARKTALRWHYRSRHESLIDFSNHNFYDRMLRIFPSPQRDRATLGLSFRHVADGVYYRGRGRYNPIEARAVAEALLEHVRASPARTIGVGAFSSAQQQAIEDEIERLRRLESDPRIEQFFDPDQDEPPFVKNLETIQGDERDVILLSVGYGFDENGRLTNNFGPINKDGGWRRLNVLVTRARMQCILFSSIKAEHIRIDEPAPRGVQALKNYLHFAELGTMPVIDAPRGEHDSPFERCVANHLRKDGWQVHAQIGCAGFSIDLAIVDPDAPGRYLVGIECDGATYHSSATARDRDRIRQAVLEGLGWTIIRVWSTDWFHQPKTALARLLAQIKDVTDRRSASESQSGEAPTTHEIDEIESEHKLQTAPPSPPGSTDSSEPPEPPDPLVEQPSDEATMLAGMAPYVRYNHPPRGTREDLLRLPVEKVTSILAEIVATEGPIHRTELLKQAASQFQCRVTTAAETHLIAAVNHAIDRSMFTMRSQFLWPAGMERPSVRWRGGDDALTQADLICPEEVAEAAVLVVQHDYGVPRDELPAATIRALGFRRVGPALAQLGETGVALAVEQGRIVTGQDGLVQPSAADAS